MHYHGYKSGCHWLTPTIMELHKSRCVGIREIEKTNHSIALKAKQSESDSELSIDGDEQAYLAIKMKRFFKTNNFDMRQASNLLNKK